MRKELQLGDGQIKQVIYLTCCVSGPRLMKTMQCPKYMDERLALSQFLNKAPKMCGICFTWSNEGSSGVE